MYKNLEKEKYDVIKSIKRYSEQLNDKIAESNSLAIFQMLPVISEFILQLPSYNLPAITEDCEKFLKSYSNFIAKCSNMSVLEQNWPSFASAHQLFIETLNILMNLQARKLRVCPCCGYTAFYAPLSNFYSDAIEKYKPTIQYTSETLNKEEYICSNCYSSDRDRLIISFMKRIGLPYMKKGIKLLQIAPASPIEKWIKENCPAVTYESTDLFMDNVTFKSDIQDMSSIPDNTYDFFICSHVLEHVQDDCQAMRELRRILKPDGMGIFLVPISLEMDGIDEAWGLSEEENWKRFGQNDHCRRYGKEGLIERLHQQGFFVHQLGKEFFGEEVFLESAFTDTSTLYILSKTEQDTEQLLNSSEGKIQLEDEPLVSVIMACYNHADFVGPAIESVLNQTYKNIEFLVADDASTDNSVEVIKRYSKFFTKEFFFSENAGGRGSFLRTQATGKYIALMNSDDLWEPDKLKKQVAFLEHNPQYAASFTWATYINSDSYKMNDEIFIRKNRNRYEWLHFFFENGNCLCHPSILIKSELYKQPLFTQAYRQLPDFSAWVKLLQQEEIYIVQENLVHMRRYNKAGTANVSTVTIETQCRHLNEIHHLWYTTIRDMEPSLFKKVFGNMFVNKDAESYEEICCEKYFLAKGRQQPIFDSIAMLLFCDYFSIPAIADCFMEKYHYYRKDFFELSGNAGIPKYELEARMLRHEVDSLKNV